jgi:hypothetical protein
MAMATMDIQVGSSKNELETVKLLYLSHWEIAFMEIMDIIAEQYGMELSQKSNGKMVPTPLARVWKETMKDLSPAQMREGVVRYMASERGNFKPAPADIIGCAPEATDKPRKTKNPKCPDCSGSGFRLVLVDSKIHEGKKARRVTDCYCVRIEYDGNTYMPPMKQLAAAPEIPDKQLFERLEKKIPGLDNAGKPFPSAYSPSDSELQSKKAEALKLAEKFHTEERP